jgi:hypothetical protein
MGKPEVRRVTVTYSDLQYWKLKDRSFSGK